MSGGAIVFLTFGGLLFLFMCLGLVGVWDRIKDGKWSKGSPFYEDPADKVKRPEKPKTLYVGMSDVCLDDDTRCAACDGLIKDAGGYFYFEGMGPLCCVDCMNRPIHIVAADLFQVTRDWRLHSYFCDCVGEPSRSKEERLKAAT